eukprot:TRINITY_DN33780_c0_g1_i2.p1 TRINITY_DN33780_c0_g1~~TRINITY_DN33780_c0_g1_i2.p1  ORF type:complete len:225 (+),score=40.96 TRINITY_DN33780_c0_g1_i2:102-776(+)
MAASAALVRFSRLSATETLAGRAALHWTPRLRFDKPWRYKLSMQQQRYPGCGYPALQRCRPFCTAGRSSGSSSSSEAPAQHWTGKDAGDPVEVEDEEDTGGIFNDTWWPVVAEKVHKNLAGRPQLLPEDPLAHGVMSFIEYELAARRPEDRPQEQESMTRPSDAAQDSSQSPGDDGTLGSAAPWRRRREDPGLTPLPTDVNWKWTLNGDGEIVGPRSGRDRDRE